MTETRTERTDFLGLLALYNADGRVQGWGWPYTNQIQLDAQINALYNAPRDGVALITAPAAPTLALEATGGYLLAGIEYEVAQTFVDTYGRETEASTVDSVTTAGSITDPAAAATLGATSESAGFAGGLLEVWYTWTDADSRETLPSPVASISLPYLASPLYNEVTVTLPVTPASVGAAGANVYIRHRGGNKVLANMTAADSQTEVVLTGTIANCSNVLPTENNTGATSLIEITGAAANGTETPAYTRFYIRKAGQTWTDADRRLKLSGVDEWDPATVSYPLTFTGSAGEIVPGYPPSIGQVKAIVPVDTTKSLVLIAVEQTTDVGATDGKMYVPIPPALNGMNLVSANAIVNTAGTTGATTIDIYNLTDSQDMLSTAASVASGDTVGTAGTVDTAHDDVATNDVLRVDVTTASTTNAKGLMVMLEFQLP
jgi:hypothetical protein